MKKFKEILEQSGAGDWGTDKARKRLQDDTPGQDSLDEVTTGQLIRRLVLAPKMKKMVRFYLDWRRENPGKGRKGVQKVIQMMGLDPRDGNQLIDTLNDLIAKGKLPDHLAIESKYGTQAQRLMSPLQKARQDKEKRDRDRDGKLKSTSLPRRKKKNEEAELDEGSETWEAGFKRRVVKTTKPEHKEKGYNWRIKGKDRPEISIKLYKNKPDFAEFKKQMKRVAGHEFGG